jgi:hypothetical protein
MVEVLLDGEWFFVENSHRALSDGGNATIKSDWAYICTHPGDLALGISGKQMQMYYDYMDTHYVFGQADGLFMWVDRFRQLELTPQTAGVLYPGVEEVWYKSNSPDRYDLVWGRPASSDPRLKLRQGQAFRRRFWLGGLQNTRAIKATFSGPRRPKGSVASEKETNVPADGGDWCVAVNDQRHYLRDQKGWAVGEGGYRDKENWAFSFDVPLEELNEHSWNTVAIGSSGRGDEFLWFGGFVPSVEPAETCFCDAVS